VCEGKTEFGFCRALERFWISKNKEPFAYVGAVPTFPVEGGGDDSPPLAEKLAKLGYDTCIFMDSDKLDQITPTVEALKSSGVTVVHWSGMVSIEERVANDLTWDALKIYISNAYECTKKILLEGGLLEDEAEMRTKNEIFDSICNKLNKTKEEIGIDIDLWKATLTEDQVRQAVGKAAKKKGWFKRTDHGELLGDTVINDLDNISGTDLLNKINELYKFIYG